MCDNERLTISLLSSSEWDTLLELSTASNQNHFIESSQRCIHDAKTDAYDIKWNFYGFYVEEKIIGFAMHGREYGRFLPTSKVWLDRFMIDKRYQGKGYGKRSLQLTLDKIFIDYSCSKIYLSVFEENTTAVELYLKSGFKKTIFKDSNNERIMVLKK